LLGGHQGVNPGLNGIDEVRDLARVKAVPVRAVSARGAAVLNADDPLVVEMAKLCRGTVVYFSRNESSHVLAAHRSAGGTVVTVIDGQLSIARGRQVTPVARVDHLPLTMGGRVGFQIDNLLASVAAAHWLGIPVDAIRSGVKSFSSDVTSAPGRFNVLTHQGSTIVLDYGHNSSALLALHANRPVKMVYNREESFTGHVHRHAARIRAEHRATRDGRLVCVRVDILLDGGAYASSSTAVTANAAAFACGPYSVPNALIESLSVYTNNPRAARCAASGRCRRASLPRRRWTSSRRRSISIRSSSGSSTQSTAATRCLRASRSLARCRSPR
jgi:UDP-N-acetylmuramoylalanine-D-glutamate ligase